MCAGVHVWSVCVLCRVRAHVCARAHAIVIVICARMCVLDLCFVCALTERVLMIFLCVCIRRHHTSLQDCTQTRLQTRKRRRHLTARLRLLNGAFVACMCEIKFCFFPFPSFPFLYFSSVVRKKVHVCNSKQADVQPSAICSEGASVRRLMPPLSSEPALRRRCLTHFLCFCNGVYFFPFSLYNGVYCLFSLQ